MKINQSETRVFALFSFMNYPLISDHKIIFKSELKRCKDKYLYKTKPFTGKVIENYSNGVRKVESSYLNGKKDGFSIEWYYDGFKKKESTYEQGVLDGFETAWDWNGNEIGSIVYKTGVPLHGRRIVFSEDDAFNFPLGYYVESYKDGSKHGEWIAYRFGLSRSSSGQIVTRGFYRNDKKDGIWIDYDWEGAKKTLRYYSESQITKELYFNEKGKITARLLYKNGQPYKGKKITEDPAKKSRLVEVYKRGFRHGKSIYELNGQIIWKHSYYRGKADGTWKEWNSKGYLKRVMHFSDGLKVGTWIEYGKPNLTWEQKKKYLQSWRKKLPCIKKSEKSYYQNMLDGKYRLRNSDNIVVQEGNYRVNKKHGKWVYRDSKGGIIKTEYWENGLLLPKK